MSYESTVNLGLPAIPNPNDPENFADFNRIYNALRILSVALDRYTGQLQAQSDTFDQIPFSTSIQSQNLQRLYVEFTDTVTYGQLVQVYNVAGVLNARLANAATPRQAHGFCSVVAGVTSGDFGEIILGGLCSAIGGLTPGTTYYLSNTPGAIGAAAGTTSQKIGYALSATQLFFRPDLLA